MGYKDVYYPAAVEAAQRYGVDVGIFTRMIEVESGWNPNAYSSAGACGIAQIVPRYHPGVDCWDPYASLDYAARLIRSYLDRYGGDYAKALACYNCGCGCVDRRLQQCGDRWVSCLPAETQKYLQLILGEGVIVGNGSFVPNGSAEGVAPMVPLLVAGLILLYFIS